jgi:hypothetical protein
MDNSPAHSRYRELSQSRQSHHVSPEPTIHHQEQEETSEDKDEERESSIKGDTHENHATATELVVALEALPVKAILPQSRKNRVRSCSRVKSLFQKLGRLFGLLKRLHQSQCRFRHRLFGL